MAHGAPFLSYLQGFWGSDGVGAVTAVPRPDEPRCFEDMTDPPLADRLRAFEQYLDAEPCQNDDHCIILSVSRSMCAPCRLRLHFYHCLYNAEAYEGTEGAIPRAAA